MASLEKLKQRKKQLLGLIEIAEKRKEKILKQAEQLSDSEKLIKEHNSYIEKCREQVTLCDKLIEKEKAKTRVETREKIIKILILLIIIVLIAILISLLFIFKTNLKNVFETSKEKISSVFGLAKEKIEVKKVLEREKVEKVEKIEEVTETKKPEIEISLEDKKVEIIEESLIQYQAVLGKPVKWKKQFTVSEAVGFNVELPENSEVISIKKIEDGKEEDISDLASVKEKGIFRKRTEVKLSKAGITGSAISNSNGKVKFEMIFETEAPYPIEEKTEKGKKVIIKGIKELRYENVFSFTELPREISKEKIETIKIYEIKNRQETKEEVKFNAYDTDENGLLDFVEWLALESDTTYELIIEISKAEHLDENRKSYEPPRDIYEQVKALDGNWSEEIKENEYVRVTFEQKLDNTRDITIYLRVVSGEPRIEVYEVDGKEKIAEFTSLISNEYNKVYLTSLKGKQDKFDLRVTGGSIEIEHIIDPVYTNQYYFIGGSSSGDGDLKQLSTNLGTGTAKWTATQNRDSVWFITQFNEDINIAVQSFPVTFWCNKTSSAKGERAQIDSIEIHNCGSTPDCSTQTPICTTRTLNLECNYIVPTKVVSSACTSTSGMNLAAGNYLGLKLVTDLNKVGINLYFNSSTYPSHINITTNQAPRIIYITPIQTISPLESSSRTVTFNVYVYDSNGADDLNNTSIMANFTKQGEALRQNLSCQYIGNIDSFTANYSCSIDMWYWDEAGIWNITVYGEDLSEVAAINNTTTFQYNELKAIKISTPEIIFGEMLTGATNQTFLEPTIINNTGNFNATGKIAIYALNLYGEESVEEYLDVGNFSVGTTTGPSCPETCNECVANVLINGTNVTIENVILEPGNLSAGQGQEELYYCLKEIPSLPSQTYSTQQAGAWLIRIVEAFVFIYSSLSNKKQKKKTREKQKTDNKKIKENNLIKALISISQELKKQYSKEKTQIIKLLTKEIKKKYKLNNREIAGIISIEKNIPLNIFREKLGALEIIVKYLKENLNLSYKEISSLVLRDERTIWTAYNKAVKKKKEALKIKEKISEIILPISIFNKNLTILESIILYLKQKGLKFSEIASLLDRDQRNIWTIYSRARKKVKFKNADKLV